MNKIAPPYKGAKLNDVSQGYGVMGTDGTMHWLVDFAPRNGYGMFLTAPEDCVVSWIGDASTIEEMKTELKNGWGIIMKSKTTDNLYYEYWHCQPVFPVNIGQEVKQGEPVARMGNSGMCFTNGVYVPLEERWLSQRGTHLHYIMFTQISGKITYFNVLDWIDFSIPISYNIYTAMIAVVQKLGNLLKGRK